MITFHVEPLMQNIPAIQGLLAMHYEELAEDKEFVPLDPQYEMYAAREQAGEVLFVCAREAGKIIGYLIGFISPGLHYKTCLTCIVDIFFIHPAYRTGSLGIRLFKFTEAELRRRGVNRWFVGSKVKHDASALFERLSFNRVEVFYSKWLGG